MVPIHLDRSFRKAKLSMGPIPALVMAANTMISAYFYSTKRSRQAVIMNLLRSFVINLAVIFLLPELLGAEAVWFTFGAYELLVLAVALYLLKSSEKNGVVFR